MFPPTLGRKTATALVAFSVVARGAARTTYPRCPRAADRLVPGTQPPGTGASPPNRRALSLSLISPNSPANSDRAGCIIALAHPEMLCITTRSLSTI